MKIIKDVDQGSQEWLDLRLGKITASNFAKIITSTGKPSASANEYMEELAGEFLMDKAESGFKSDAMIRGNELEEEARQAYEEERLQKVEEVTMIDCDKWAYSPDGLVGDDGLIEIKCPLAKAHSKYIIDNKLPSKYKAQVQGGLFVSGRKWCDFISYNPNFKEGYKLFIVRVNRDEEFIEKLEKELVSCDKKKQEIINKIIKENE